VSGRYNRTNDSNVDSCDFIGGGGFNYVSEPYSTVCGGFYNWATGPYAFIGGGCNNKSESYGGVVFGGVDNVVGSAPYSAAIGGRADTITGGGAYSFVFGYGVYTIDDYRVVFFDSLHDGSLNINRDGRDGAVNSYPIQVGTNSSNGNGAYLTSGGVWTNGSSRTFKENFTPFDGNELLSKVSNLSVTTYNYINSTEKHVGPVAEEFVEVFDVGVIRESDGKRDDQYLAASDVAGVALAGVQELIKQNRELKVENENMKTAILELEGRLTDLERGSR
jgi:hypothetical protein